MTTQRDWAAAKAAMLGVAEQYFGPIPRDKKVRCPFHADDSPSLHIYDDGWHCYGCAEGGDAVDLVSRLDGVDKVEALRRITGGGLGRLAELPPPKKKPQTWAYQPGAHGVPSHPVYGEPHKVYAYLRDGDTVGLVCRWDWPGRDKVVRPASSVRDLATAEIRWEWVSMDKPRPLYRPESVKGKLVVVEGEKAVDHLRAMGIEACTWAGGANAVTHADWSMVTAGTVYVWPDNDPTGHQAAAEVAGILKARGVEVLTVPVADLPEGHDAADLTDRAAIVDRIRSAIKPSQPEPERAKPQRHHEPFRCLGYQDNTHYFLHLERQVVVEAQPHQMTKPWLIGLLGLDYLATYFPKEKGLGFDAEAAMDALCKASTAMGHYSPERYRGRGIWWDRGRIIYHAGDVAIVDGVQVRLSDVDSKFTYPIQPALPRPAEPLTDDEANQWILGAAWQPSWHMPVQGILLGGWAMCSLLAGVLKWRPSVWLMAPAGTGKSVILDEFLSRIMGRMAEHVLGSSTEAGIRQTMKWDARAIVMDEAEPGDDPDARRMKNLLTMMRQASRDGGAQTLRGTVSGRAQSYHARSPWCFASVQGSTIMQADRERVTRLALRSVKSGNITKDEAETAYRNFKAVLASWPEDIHERLLARALGVAPIAREVVEVMTQAIRPTLTNQREADQLGTLMGGAWLLQRSSVPTADEALAYVARYDWEAVNEAVHETDAERAWQALLSMRINDSNGLHSVAQRLKMVRGSQWVDENRATLAAYGLSMKPGDLLFVCHTDQNLVAEFNKTPYRAFGDLLASLPGVTKSRQKCGSPTTRYGLLVPLNVAEID